MGTVGGAGAEVDMVGGEVIVWCSCVVVTLGSTEVWSWHPQNRPGVKQVVLVSVGVGVGGIVVVVLVVVLSLHPNQPLDRVSVVHKYNWYIGLLTE